MQIANRKERKKNTEICQMRKDNFESERLVIKMLLIAGNK